MAWRGGKARDSTVSTGVLAVVLLILFKKSAMVSKYWLFM